MRLIDADALLRRAKKVATEAWKMKLKAPIEITLNQFIDWINEAPTAEVESHWIPVTEQPIPDGEYLVTWSSDIQEKPILSIICRYGENWDFWELDMLGHRDIKILAYMPLPEPYKRVTK